MSIIVFIDLNLKKASGGILGWFLVENQKSDECRVQSKQ